MELGLYVIMSYSPLALFQVLPYDLLMQELDVTNVRELEDFLISECMYVVCTMYSRPVFMHTKLDNHLPFNVLFLDCTIWWFTLFCLGHFLFMKCICSSLERYDIRTILTLCIFLC